MEAVTLSYRGIAICPDARAEQDGAALVVHTTAPMPVGTSLEVAFGEAAPDGYRVTAVQEGHPCTMRLEPGY